MDGPHHEKHFLLPKKLAFGYFLWDPPWVTPIGPAQYQLAKRFPSGSNPVTPGGTRKK